MIGKLSMMTGALILTGAAAFSSRSEASERVFVGVNAGQPAYYAPVVERQYVPGHYELRTETVVVEPERRVHEWIAPQTTSQTDARGYVYTVTNPGHYRDVRLPARYETREVQVWVAGYYQDIGVERPVVRSRPYFSLGGFFRF